MSRVLITSTLSLGLVWAISASALGQQQNAPLPAGIPWPVEIPQMPDVNNQVTTRDLERGSHHLK